MESNERDALSGMTLKERIALCSGASAWETKTYPQCGVPALVMCDGPSGLRKQARVSGAGMLDINESEPATCFPAPVTTACSWDTALLSEIGAAIGAEAKACGVGLVLGPGANLKRNPLCGRNFEYFSEDPLLSGKLAAGIIQGLQQNGVGASLKHFACNSQELSRLNSNSVLDERTLREMYLTAFEIAVKEGQPETVMCAYNKINGVHCSDDERLLTGILRDEWGFAGTVVTDWGAMNDRIAAFRAGCDLNMPGGSAYMEKDVLRAVQSGVLSEQAVNDCAARIIRLMRRAAIHADATASFDPDAHHALARKAAAQGAVLLQNEGALLPLCKDAHVALIGDMAQNPRFQGAGSSHVNPHKIASAKDTLPQAVFAAGCNARGDTTEALLAEAAQVAKDASVAVVFVGLPPQYESEGFDRDDMRMPAGHVRLIETVAAANPNTVVVLCCGAPVECPWAERVKAILYMGLAGQASGEAAIDLLFGDANPCGKLAESWCARYEDCPSADCYAGHKNAQYREGVYIGYRYYQKAGVKPRWAFGYGLSYTRFAYTALCIEADAVTATVENVGSCAGAEVAQLYIEPPQNGLYRPLCELKGFQKVFLQPGERALVRFSLDPRCFALWDDGWKTPGGTYGIRVGSSSDDLPLHAMIERSGAPISAPAWQAGSWYERPSGTPSQAAWETMLGRPFTESTPCKGSFTMDDTVQEMAETSGLMRLVYKTIRTFVSRSFGSRQTEDNPEYCLVMRSIASSPLRMMQICSGVKGGAFRGLLDMANGRILRGLRHMLGF